MTASPLRRPRFWFASGLACAVVTIGFAFTLVGLIAEAATLMCLLTGTALVIVARHRA